MKLTRLLNRWPLLLLPLAGAVRPASSTSVHGEYVEARTASVFAGACHYNGERVTEGRSAVFACNIVGGSYQNVDLSKVRIAVAVTCDENLAERDAARRCAIVVDADNDARASAAVAWLKTRCGHELGSVIDTHRGAVAFRHADETFAVLADGFAAMSVHAMPDHACCTQPELVWYQPMMSISNRRVGFTESATLETSKIGPTWHRSAENSAFYGSFDQ